MSSADLRECIDEKSDVYVCVCVYTWIRAPRPDHYSIMGHVFLPSGFMEIKRCKAEHKQIYTLTHVCTCVLCCVCLHECKVSDKYLKILS